jgi:hypothetical protein
MRSATVWNTDWNVHWDQDGGGGADVLVSISVTSALGTNPTWRPTAGTDRLQFTATGTYSVSGPVDVTDTCVWSSVDTGCATIASGVGTGGEATAVSANNLSSGVARNTLITATIGAINGSNVLSVDTDRDATSGIRVPVNAYQWTTLLGYTPTSLWLCQEASGNLTDTLGGQTLTAANTPLYQQAVAGWDRDAVQLANGTGQRFAHATFANSAAVSLFVLAYTGYNSATITAGNHLLVYGSNNDCSISNGDAADERKVRYREGTNITEGANTLTTGTIYPVGLLRNLDTINAGAAPVARAYSDSEKLSPAYDVSVGTVLSLGSAAGSSSAPMDYVYVVAWSGATAEMSDATIKDIYTALGWAPSWT